MLVARVSVVSGPLSVVGSEADMSDQAGQPDPVIPAIVDRDEFVPNLEIVDSYDDGQILRNEAISSVIGSNADRIREPDRGRRTWYCRARSARRTWRR